MHVDVEDLSRKNQNRNVYISLYRHTKTLCYHQFNLLLSDSLVKQQSKQTPTAMHVRRLCTFIPISCRLDGWFHRWSLQGGSISLRAYSPRNHNWYTLRRAVARTAQPFLWTFLTTVPMDALHREPPHYLYPLIKRNNFKNLLFLNHLPLLLFPLCSKRCRIKEKIQM